MKIIHLVFFFFVSAGHLLAQTLIPLQENRYLQQYEIAQQRALPKAFQQPLYAIEKEDCPIFKSNIIYTEVGQSILFKIAIDTIGLGGAPGNFSCNNCGSATFGIATLFGDTLSYIALPNVEAGQDDIRIEFCNPNGCKSKTYSIIAKRKGRVQFQPAIPLNAGGMAEISANASLLPGRKAACGYLLDCEDSYEGTDQEVSLSDPINRIRYRASRYAGIDSVCVVLCDTFTVCDTFKFAFRIRQDTLQLPFMDDFSYFGPYAAASHWLDLDAFVNNDMADSPPSWGVITFDGLNSGGNAYGGGYGPADKLTSAYIDLRNTGEVQLTYWVQRRGFGDRPEKQDSLVLEFKDKTGKWNFIRSFEGAGIDQPNTAKEPFLFYTDPIPAAYKYKGFQFRFRNYSDRTGILDVWHLDYVRMDENVQDSIFDDLAFTRLPNFILKNYTSMPWWHFKGNEQAELRDSLFVGVWNHFNETQPAIGSTARLFEINSDEDLFSPAFPTLFNGLESNILNGAPLLRRYSLVNDPSGFPQVWNAYLNKMQSPIFDDYDRLEFRLEFTLKNTSQNNAKGYEAVGRNDGVRRYTIFDNYFSYDDGTAEAGLVAQLGIQVAAQYRSYVADSLRAVQFFFPHTTTNISAQRFSIKVWVGNLDDSPEYEAFAQIPYYADVFFDTLQGFTTYPLVDELGNPKPLALPVGNFYIGWQQETPCEGTRCVPVGYDRNTPQGRQYLWRNLGSSWSAFPNTFLPGALMIRPVVGAITPPATATNEPQAAADFFRIYPNPTSDRLYIQPATGLLDSYQCLIFNSLGQQVLNEQLQSSIWVDYLSPGIYFMKIVERQSNQIWHHKFIVKR